jgi:hypothetical protein
MPDIYTDVADLQRKIKRALGGALPTYAAITLASASYSIAGKGIYQITVASASNKIIFPEPVLSEGAQITVINSDGSVAIAIDNTNGFAPVNRGSTTVLASLAANSQYIFVSINGKWRGGALA